MSCKTCRFHHYDEPNAISECRRYPPTLHRLRRGTINVAIPLWPEVADDNWCGEEEDSNDYRLSLPFEQDEVIMRNLRGASIMVGALLRRMGQDEVLLSATELVEGPGSGEVTIEQHGDGSRTIRIPERAAAPSPLGEPHSLEYPKCPRCGSTVVGAMMTSEAIEHEGQLYYHQNAVSVYCLSSDCNFDRKVADLKNPPRGCCCGDISMRNCPVHSNDNEEEKADAEEEG